MNKTVNKKKVKLEARVKHQFPIREEQRVAAHRVRSFRSEPTICRRHRERRHTSGAPVGAPARLSQWTDRQQSIRSHALPYMAGIPLQIRTSLLLGTVAFSPQFEEFSRNRIVASCNKMAADCWNKLFCEKARHQFRNAELAGGNLVCLHKTVQVRSIPRAQEQGQL